MRLGMIKFRFPMLKTGIRLAHEDGCTYLTNACVKLQNSCFKNGDHKKEEVVFDEENDLDREEENIK